MSKTLLGREALNQIADAFGLSPEVNRVVIDIALDGPPRIIVCDLLTQEKQDALLRALKACNTEVIS